MLGKLHIPLSLSTFLTSTDLSDRHYVAFIRKNLPDEGKSWVLYNDEKVVKANDVEEMKKFAYVYFFERV